MAESSDLLQNKKPPGPKCIYMYKYTQQSQARRSSLGFGVSGLGFRDWGSGFRVRASMISGDYRLYPSEERPRCRHRRLLTFH